MVKFVMENGKLKAGSKNHSVTTGLSKTIVEMVTANTQQNFTVKDGKFVSQEIPHLGELKRRIFALPHNPHNLVDPATGHTNAKVHNVARRVSIKPVRIENVEVKLSAKRVNRLVVYWNPQEARRMIAAEKNKEAKALMQAKFSELSKLEDAYPL